MSLHVAPHPRHDDQLFYEWIETNFWYRFTADLPPVDNRGRYNVWRAKDRVEPTLEALLDELDSAEQERVLRFTTGKPFDEELGAIEDGCECSWCEPARQRWQREAQTPRDQRLRAALVHTLVEQFELHSRFGRSCLAGLAFRYRWRRPAAHVKEPAIVVAPPPAVNPAFAHSRVPWRWFFGTEEHLSVYLKVVPPAWPLLVKLLGPPCIGEEVQYTADVNACVEAVAAHIGYGRVIPLNLQRQVLEWTWRVPKVGWTCHILPCQLPQPMRRTSPSVPDDWIHHKFAHALKVLLVDALRHKSPVDRDLGMPLVTGLWLAEIPRIPIDSPYVCYPT